MKFAAFLSSSPLQFGFKAGSSTTLCTGMVKNVVSRYMKVRWDHSLSESFHVSNGVRQGGVLSPVLFAVYLDGLLEELADSGCGCYWRNLFAGAFCYADDIVLLAPCASALRVMLNICCLYSSHHGLKFNPGKSQLICFRLRHTLMIPYYRGTCALVQP